MARGNGAANHAAFYATHAAARKLGGKQKSVYMEYRDSYGNVKSVTGTGSTYHAANADAIHKANTAYRYQAGDGWIMFAMLAVALLGLIVFLPENWYRLKWIAGFIITTPFVFMSIGWLWKQLKEDFNSL